MLCFCSTLRRQRHSEQRVRKKQRFSKRSSADLCMCQTRSSHLSSLILYPMTHSHNHVSKPFSRSPAPSSALSHSPSLLFFINSHYSHLFFPSLQAFASLMSPVLTTQRDSECNIKAIHNLQDAECNTHPHTSTPPPAHTHLLSIPLAFSALSNTTE